MKLEIRNAGMFFDIKTSGTPPNYRPIKSFKQPADQKTCFPPCVLFITLITYQFSLLPLLVLACLSASLCGLTLAFTLPHTGVDLSTYVILSFFEPLFVPFTLPPIVFRFFLPKFFYSSPLGLVTHFLLSSTLFTFLTCFSQLASLPACSLCCLCCPVVVRVSWTEGDSVRVGKPHTSLSTIPGHRQQARCGAPPPPRPVKPGNLVLQPLYPPPVPVVIETISPTALSP